MRTRWSLVPALLLAGMLPAQTPPPAAEAAQAGSAATLPALPAVLKAEYLWGYADARGTGKGTCNILLEPAKGRVVLELMGLGERLLLLEGDSGAGYRIRVPRQDLDRTAATLGAVPLPFFPQLASVDALYRLLAEGAGPGVKVTRRDATGPVKLNYQGTDDRGKEVMVWLERKRWEAEAAKAPPA